MFKMKKLASLLVAAVLILSCTVVAMAAEEPTAVVSRETTITLDEVFSLTNEDGTISLSYNETVAERYLNIGDNTPRKARLYFKADISSLTNVESAELRLSVPKINNGSTLYVKKITNWEETFGSVALTAGSTVTVNASEVTLPVTGDTLATAEYEYMPSGVENPVDNKVIDLSGAIKDAVDNGEDTLAFVLEYATNRNNIDSFNVYGYGKGTQAPKIAVKYGAEISAKVNFVEEKTVQIAATAANSGATDKDKPTENVLALGTWESGKNELIVNSSSDKRIFYKFDLTPYIGKIQKAELKVAFNTKKWSLEAVSQPTTAGWSSDSICYDNMPAVTGNAVKVGGGANATDSWLAFDHTDYIKTMTVEDAVFSASVYAQPVTTDATDIAKVYGVNHSGLNPYLEITYLEEATAFNSEGMVINCSVNSDFGTARPIVALFNGEALIDTIIYDEMDLSVSNSLTQAITAEELAGATSAKVFLWESLGTLMPLCVNDEL